MIQLAPVVKQAEAIVPMLKSAGVGVRSILKYGAERKQAPIRERIAFFEDELSPLYVEMEEIHRNYMEICRTAITSLGGIIIAAGTDVRPDALNDTSRPHVTIKQIKLEFQANRQDLVTQRDMLRREARAIFHQTSQLIDEASFLYTIWNYFMRGDLNLSKFGMTNKASYLASGSGDQTTNTPSRKLYSRIENEEDPDVLSDIFVKERDQLCRYWSEVCERYSDLRRAARLAKKNISGAT